MEHILDHTKSNDFMDTFNNYSDMVSGRTTPIVRCGVNIGVRFLSPPPINPLSQH